MTKMKKILIGITGGIAAYKAASVVSALKQAGHDVQVAMTPAACQFVTPLTFAALSQKEVRTDLFPPNPTSDKGQLYPHLYPATEADLFIVLPATADIIGKFAYGFGDDIVSASALSLPGNELANVGQPRRAEKRPNLGKTGLATHRPRKRPHGLRHHRCRTHE